ncbi:hypothetical protein ACFY5H_26700 [Streptomyces sp. NPDC013012]|uniref:effector-associated constant component EACC1 n=1 Tax=Streptomyces sp. NPDC013012 TaxID=3364860 RepID=UPI003698FED9
MRTVITVHAEGEGADAAHDLRRWLSAEPALRGRIRAGAEEAVTEPGAMGIGADALLALLAPGGVAAVFAGAVVAWAQTRRGSQTITITRPDGTEITIASEQVRGLDARQSAELARTLATELSRTTPEAPPAVAPGPTSIDDSAGVDGTSRLDATTSVDAPEAPAARDRAPDAESRAREAARPTGTGDGTTARR